MNRRLRKLIDKAMVEPDRIPTKTFDTITDYRLSKRAWRKKAKRTTPEFERRLIRVLERLLKD